MDSTPFVGNVFETQSGFYKYKDHRFTITQMTSRKYSDPYYNILIKCTQVTNQHLYVMTWLKIFESEGSETP